MVVSIKIPFSRTLYQTYKIFPIKITIHNNQLIISRIASKSLFISNHNPNNHSSKHSLTRPHILPLRIGNSLFKFLIAIVEIIIAIILQIATIIIVTLIIVIVVLVIAASTPILIVSNHLRISRQPYSKRKFSNNRSRFSLYN